METFSKRLSPLESQVALVLGNFDGFHKGHMTLLEEAKRISINEGIQSAVFSFEPHPSFVLAHKEPVDLINTRREKEMVFELLGMDYYFEFPFTMELAALEPECFIRDLLLEQVTPHTIVVGEDYHFGKKRAGDVNLLKALGEKYNFNVSVLPKMTHEDQEISSTWIRSLIKEGDIEKANYLIGRPFFITGIVKEGAKIGRTIGYPTANLIPETEKLLPPFGVYVTKLTFDNREFYGMTNVGDRPTMESEGVTVETFILDFDENIYGKEIRVDFLNYIREELKFDSLDALKDQITKDVARIGEYRD